MSKKFKKFIATFLAIILSWPLTSLALILSGSNVAHAAESDVVINEILANPSSGNEKIELYNKGSEAVDISGWKLEQSTGTNPIPTVGSNPFASSTSLTPGSYYVVETSSPQLANSGETVTLKNASATIIDNVTYPSLSPGESYARKPDGGSTFYKDPTPTIGTTNGPIPTPSALAMTPAGGTMLANTLNSTNTNFTASATIPVNEGISSVALFLDGAPFSPAINDTSIASSDTSATFDPGLTNNANLQTLVKEGNHSIRALAIVDGLPGGLSDSLSILADYTAPTSTIATSGTFGPNTWPGKIKGTASDALSGVKAVSLLLRGPDGLYWDGTKWVSAETWFPPTSGTTNWSYNLPQLTLAKEGTYNIQAKAQDNAGNEGLFVGSTFVWDTTAPAAPDLSPVTAPVNATTYNIQGSAENGSTIKIYSGGTVTATGHASTFSIPVPLVQNTTNTFTVTATDVAGNESARANISIVEDSTFPDITITSPANGSATNINTPEVWFTTNEGSVLDVTIDGTSLGAIPVGSKLSTLSDGQHTLAVRAEDSAGNITIKYSNFTVDTTPPTPGVTTNPDGATVGPGGTVVFEGNTEPGAGVTLEIFSATVTKTTIADSSGHWRIEVALSEIGAGEHSTYVTMTDALGNKARTQIADFVVKAKSLAKKLKGALGVERAEAAGIAQKPSTLKPEKAEAKEEGAIKAEEAAKTARNWTGVITTLAILVIAAGVGTAGFYGYEWWTGGGSRAPEVPRPRGRGRPRSKTNSNGPPRTRW